MNTIRALLDSDIPAIAVSFADRLDEKLTRDARDSGVDIAEIRVDRYSSTDPQYVVSHISGLAGLPLLATIRSGLEGGEWTGSEAQRNQLFREIIPFVESIDIELSAETILADVTTFAKANDTVVIVSYHNFELTPPAGELDSIVARAKAAGADYVKISTMVHSEADVRTLAALTIRLHDEGIIVIAMGARGTISRILFPALGSRLTYTFIGNPSAPGQLDFDETFYLLRKFYPDFNRSKVESLHILEDV